MKYFAWDDAKIATLWRERGVEDDILEPGRVPVADRISCPIQDDVDLCGRLQQVFTR